MEDTVKSPALWMSVQTSCVMEVRETGTDSAMWVMQREALLSKVASGALVGQK